MLREMSDTLGPLAPDAWARAEQEAGGPLPLEYKRFLERFNGGSPTPSGFRIRWSGQEWAERWSTDMVQQFLGIQEGSPADLLSDVRVYRGRIPADTIPIGYDPGGNLLLLGVRGANTGKVFFWLQDYEIREGGEPDYRNVGEVAPNLDAFLDSLFEP
ncbi:SMI1/KNR4 family protein [Archangium sp.]|uniref:SMI1/KNR4 family protein n=1 Tax=Archangium sp. TaxID=1872627 RepID=UPI002D2EC9B8|nr:SMI1/KNR4 family protein [Archangium sp.]HYO55635.1 SMI1/KNR4 family protein [Archangium sp.]